jgi:hypothetical protein
VSCLIAWRAYLFDIGNPYVVGDDARLVLLGVLRFSNPEWFPDDVLTDYAESFVTPGVRGLYFLTANLIDPIAFSKIISFSLFVISTLFLFQLMYEITASKLSSILAILFFVSISTFKVSLSGGFPRSFSILLTILFLLFLIKKSWLKVAITLMTSSLLYPLTFLICCGTFVLSSFSLKNQRLSIDRDRHRFRALTRIF